MSSLDELRQLARQLNFSEAEIEAFIATHLQRPPTWAEQQSLILAQVNAYLTEILKPRWGIPHAPHPEHPYTLDITATWRKRTLVFTHWLYHPRSQTTIAVEYAQLTKQAGDAFNVAYIRHNGRPWILYEQLPLAECLAAMLEHELLQP